MENEKEPVIVEQMKLFWFTKINHKYYTIRILGMIESRAKLSARLMAMHLSEEEEINTNIEIIKISKRLKELVTGE